MEGPARIDGITAFPFGVWEQEGMEGFRAVEMTSSTSPRAVRRPVPGGGGAVGSSRPAPRP